MLIPRCDAPFADEQGQGDLARKSARGGVVTLSSQAARFALQLASTVVLARLLTPADFGLIGMVSVIVAFGQVLREAGLPTATVQQSNLTVDQASAMFWANAATSVGLGLLLAVSAPLVSRFYGQPELTSVTVVLAVAFALGGLGNQHAALLQRRFFFTSLAVTQIAAQAAYLVVAVVMALTGLGYWSLAGGLVAQALVLLATTLAACRWRPRRPRRGVEAAGMLRFGAGVLGFDIANYFSRNMDNILIGRYLGAAPLGLYSRAYGLFMLPVSQVRAPIGQVALPVLSSLRLEPDRYRHYSQLLLSALGLLIVPMVLLCVWEADLIVRLALGPQWEEAVPVFRILAVGALVQPVASARGLVLLSLGLSQRYFRWGVANAILNVAAFVAGLPFGIKGVAAAYAIVNYAILVPSLHYCFSSTPVRVSDFWRAMLGPLGVGMAASLVFLPGLRMGGSGWVLDAIASIAFVGVYSGGVWSIRPLRQAVMTMWSAVRQPPPESVMLTPEIPPAP